MSIKMHKLSKKFRKKVLFSDKIIGFFFEVEDKFHPVARVFLPRVSDVLPKMEKYLPFTGPEATLGARLTKTRPMFKKCC